MLEVCIDSLESAVNAIHGGADELEVCSSLPEGGLTPSPGLVKEIVKMNPKVNVMIRCRAGSDFCYTPEEMDTMLSDIKIYKKMGIDRFVFGALTLNQEIDEENCLRVISEAQPVPVTFHRAYDLCKQPKDSLNKIVNLGFNRVLTSGQRPSAIETEAIELIQSLLTMYGERIEIMPGAGVSEKNAKTFTNIGCKIVHSSCKSLRQLRSLENNLCMGTVNNENLYVTDENIVKNLKKSITLLL